MSVDVALTAVLVPVGIAYAVASGVPGIWGLYATMAGLLSYALFGPSRILVLGPDPRWPHSSVWVDWKGRVGGGAHEGARAARTAGPRAAPTQAR